MGIDINSWRCRIGNFRGGRSHHVNGIEPDCCECAIYRSTGDKLSDTVTTEEILNNALRDMNIDDCISQVTLSLGYIIQNIVHNEFEDIKWFLLPQGNNAGLGDYIENKGDLK